MSFSTNKYLLATFALVSTQVVASEEVIDINRLSIDFEPWFGFGAGITSTEYFSQQGSFHEDVRGLNLKLDSGLFINEYLGAYLSFDSFDGSDMVDEMSLLTLGAIGRYRINQDFTLFAKAGGSYVLDDKVDHVMFGSVGFGIEYHIVDPVTIRVGYDYYDKVSIPNDTYVNLSQAYFGFTYNFTTKQRYTTLVSNAKLDWKYEPTKDIGTTTDFDLDQTLVYEFSFDSDQFIPDVYIDQLIDVLRSNSEYSLSITGHTDNVGKGSYNMRLSKRRAMSAQDYIVSKGIPTSRINVFGKGSEAPVKSNSTEEGRRANRRVEINVHE